MPKYLIRDTSDESLSTIEGALPLDLGALLANGTYGVSALSNEVVVTVDANPVLTLPTATSTGETTATWGVTSNEAGGTIYAGVRPTASAALTEPQLIAGSGGAGVAWDSYTTPTADAANGGSFTGLTAGTAYKTDIVQVDSAGNESTVVSSAEFTTDAATATDILAGDRGSFSDAALWSTDAGVSVTGGEVVFNTSANFTNIITPAANRIPAPASTTLDLSIECTVAAGSSRFKIEMTSYEASNAVISGSTVEIWDTLDGDPAFSTTGTYTKSAAYTTPAGTAFVTLKFQAVLSGTTGSFDNLKLEY